MPDLLDRIRKELNVRIRELRPVVREFERLERAGEAIAGAGARRVPAPRSRSGSSPADRSAAAPARGKGKPRSAATKPAPRRPSPARGSAGSGRKTAPRGQTQAKVLEALGAAPGSGAVRGCEGERCLHRCGGGDAVAAGQAGSRAAHRGRSLRGRRRDRRSVSGCADRRHATGGEDGDGPGHAGAAAYQARLAFADSRTEERTPAYLLGQGVEHSCGPARRSLPLGAERSLVQIQSPRLQPQDRTGVHSGASGIAMRSRFRVGVHSDAPQPCN
jgi:hypothetical protein